MLKITWKYFGFFSNKPPASSVAHIAREILTYYSCLYYSSCTFLSACLFIYLFLQNKLEFKKMQTAGTGLESTNTEQFSQTGLNDSTVL